jgi:hypothetical protein
MIDWKLVRVDYRMAMEELKPMVNGYRRSWSRFKVGVTAHPELRWQDHQSDDWTKMVVVYEALSPDIAQYLERDLIDYCRRCNFAIDIENINPGGEGITPQRRKNYLYLLLA